MSVFTPMNPDPDAIPQDDFDNTRDLQIEEALKLFQTALKLHSEGPAHYDAARTAYDALFRSDIFKYPESILDFTRSLEAGIDVEPDLTYSLEMEIAGTGSDAPSNLPQTLYLAYKNHGQFILDCLRHKKRAGQDISEEELLQGCKLALEQFTQALSRDESDTELWRRAARISHFLGSRRTARYCLEAALEVDDDPTAGEVDPTNLEEGFAGVQLKDLFEVLEDDYALHHPHPIMKPYIKKTMNARLKKYMDPYPFLPAQAVTKRLVVQAPSERLVIEVPERSWCALGDALWQTAITYEGSASGITIQMPEDSVMVELDLHDGPVSVPAKALSPTISEPATVDAARNQSEDAEDQANQVQPVVEGDVALASRKRSISVAGISHTPDDESGAQKRSKRLRNKEPPAAVVATLNTAPQDDGQLHEFSQGDYHMFDRVDTLLQKLGIADMGTFDAFQDALSTTPLSDHKDRFQNSALLDLQEILNYWDERKAQMFALGNGIDVLGPSSGDPRTGLATFLEHTKKDPQKLSVHALFPPAAGLASLVESVNSDWMPVQDVVYEFFKALRHSYRQSLWSEALKITLMRLMTQFDAPLLERLRFETDHLSPGDDEFCVIEEYIMMIFELHLDVYASITNPSSVVGYSVRVEQKESLDRWAELCSDVVQSSLRDPSGDTALRYLWASVLLASMTEGVAREYVLLLWGDLQNILNDAGAPKVDLQNNAAMPEISGTAADLEISRLTTMDFFMGLFRVDSFDPLTIIETLEPVLDPSSFIHPPPSDTEETPPAASSEAAGFRTSPADALPLLRDMWKFLEGGSVALRLFLWQRLREGYEKIGYETKVFSCHLRSIEIIVADLQSPSHVDVSAEARQSTLLNWLRTLDGLLVKSLTLALNNTTAFEILDDEHLKTSIAAVAQLTRLLHTAALFDDKLRVGMVQLPRTVTFADQGSFSTFLVHLKDMQVRSWALLYALLKEGMSQNKDLFPTMDNDLADYLAAVHYSLGLRKSCKASNKIFIKMMRVELVRLKHIEKWEDYLGQVLYDLYGIRLGAGLYELEEHECPTETLDRRTTSAIIEQVTNLANRMSMKDLQKSELRMTIERMQQAIGPAKQTSQMSHNLRNYTDYLKRSIDPLFMHQALLGKIVLDNVPVVSTESPLADRMWYSLLGNMALFKFRSQKRLTAGATDDLKVAASFFRLQIQYTPEHWETWYRLAQCFDAELEEDVMWSADKVNNDRGPLAQTQRSSIHCYLMAVSVALRSADARLETAGKISDMFHDFGVRLYSSSREPFGMEAFYMDSYQRHFSGPSGMYTKRAHSELTRFKAWRFAAQLFQRALKEKPSYWLNHYMLGKCLWKMYRRVDEEPDVKVRATRPTVDVVISAFLKAIEHAPKPRDSRSEPVLDPHYKLVSVVHKLVCAGDLLPQDAAKLLQNQPYAVRKGDAVEISDYDSWEAFILESIRHIRNADKSNWHHRMIARTAHILCPDGVLNHDHAVAGRAELMKSMFTKTMAINVWRPEFERAGRHCVYTERYIRYMIRMLNQLGDKPTMEALAKRVRKKGADIFRFDATWVDCCLSYAKMIRKIGGIPMSQDDVVKTIAIDDFNNIADALQQWVDTPGTTHPVLDTLKEALELKKLNQNLMRPWVPLDDLISDSYAKLVLDVGQNLPRPQLPPPAAESRMPQPGPMSLNNMVTNMVDTSMQSVVDDISRPSRPKGPGRRDIMRRAEALVTRVLEAPRAAPIPARSRPSMMGSSSNSGRNSDAGNTAADLPHDPSREDEEDADGYSSAPGSVHDSADDESDASDAPDIEESLIFPNLTKTGSPGSTPATVSTPVAGDS